MWRLWPDQAEGRVFQLPQEAYRTEGAAVQPVSHLVRGDHQRQAEAHLRPISEATRQRTMQPLYISHTVGGQRELALRRELVRPMTRCGTYMGPSQPTTGASSTDKVHHIHYLHFAVCLRIRGGGVLDHCSTCPHNARGQRELAIVRELVSPMVRCCLSALCRLASHQRWW